MMTRRHFTALIAWGVAIPSCHRRSSSGLIQTYGTFPSPSGSLVLTMERREKSLVDFKVAAPGATTPLFASDRIGSDAMRWFLYWESDRVLWAYGSDAGYFARIDFPTSSTPTENPVAIGSPVPRPVWEALSTSAREKYNVKQ